MRKIFVGIRDVDEKTFQQFKEVTLAERAKLGPMLTFAMRKVIEEKRKNKENHRKENLRRAQVLLRMKPVDFGLGNERLSEQIDDILYGTR